jgi:uncharacterized protein (TIGR00269 family)
MGRCCKFFTECKSPAATIIPYSNLALCRNHFLQYVENRVQRTIEKAHLLRTKTPEKVLLALSGGKDSQTLLFILHKLYGSTIPMEGLYIELGIKHELYSHRSEEMVQQTCVQLGIPFHSINIKATYGLDMDDIHWMIQTFDKRHWLLGRDHFKGDCSYCGSYKRYSINKFAAEHGFTKVATGHNLSDEATALLVNFFNGDINFMVRSGPINDNHIPMLVPRIKPLFFLSEEEITLYAYYNHIPFVSIECKYSEMSPNPHIKRELQHLSTSRPGLMLSMMRQYQHVLKPILAAHSKPEQPIESYCKICGMPSTQKRCAFCRQQTVLMKRFRQVTKSNHKSSPDIDLSTVKEPENDNEDQMVDEFEEENDISHDPREDINSDE